MTTDQSSVTVPSERWFNATSNENEHRTDFQSAWQKQVLKTQALFLLVEGGGGGGGGLASYAASVLAGPLVPAIPPRFTHTSVTPAPPVIHKSSNMRTTPNVHCLHSVSAERPPAKAEPMRHAGKNSHR